MNDRYLYRAKRTDNGEWVIGNRMDDGVTGQVFIHAVGNSVNESDKVGEEGCLRFVAFEVDPSTICQCTGLTDKNGKLIWENDIIRYADMIIGTEKIDRIELNETHASFVRLHTSQMGLQYFYIDEFIANGCEVIGNIFENPELMELN